MDSLRTLWNFSEQEKPVLGHLPSWLRVPIAFEKRYLAKNTGFLDKHHQRLNFPSNRRKIKMSICHQKRPVVGTRMVKTFFVNYRFLDKGGTIVLSVTCPHLVFASQQPANKLWDIKLFLLTCYTPPSKCPGGRSDFHRGPSDRRIWSIFSGEPEFCNEDSIIIGGEPFLRENDFSNISPGFACLLPRFHL